MTRVNLKNHNYRDVTVSPIDEFDSNSSFEEIKDIIGKPIELWMCGASCRSIEIGPKECARAKEIRETWEQAGSYVPIPSLTL